MILKEVTFGIVLVFLISTAAPMTLERTNRENQSYISSIPTSDNNSDDTGLILYTPMLSSYTYLIDREGTVLNTWQSNYFPGLSAYLLPNGNLLRPKRMNFEPGASGGIQEFSPDGELLWDYTYYSYGEYMTHHDVKALPNGNVLSLSHVYLSYSDLVELGRNPSTILPGGMKLEKILEIKPTGPTSGDIVWEWSSTEHLIQDYDPTKLNYGTVGEHPELIDINYYNGLDEDLFHCNSIDYNPASDQILVSCRNYNELWVINRTTGELVYRWGNPETYRASGEQQLFWQHDATWIKPGYPGASHLLVFNNGVGRGYSTVDEINPTTGMIVWSYTHDDFLASMYCGTTRLPSGNTLICDSDYGLFFEVDPSGTIMWQYQAQDTNGKVFKIDYFLPNENQVDCIGGFSWDDVQPNSTIIGSFLVHNKGQTPLAWDISEYPTWGTWQFNQTSGVILDEINITVTIIVPDQQNTAFEGFIKVSNHDNQEDYDIVPIYLRTPLTIQNIPSGVIKKPSIPFSLVKKKICQ